MTTLKLMTKEKEETMDMEYPAEIYRTLGGGMLTSFQRKHWNEGGARRHAYLVGYEAGKAAQVDPLEGYSNLTEAIKASEPTRAGKPIDWGKLGGLKVQCIKPGVGALQGKLEQFSHYYPFTPSAWWSDGADSSYVSAFNQAWKGEGGWTLWVEGEVPLRRKTADQLKVGTYFMGEAPGGEPDLVYVGGCGEASKAIYYTPSIMKSATPASKWLVVEELGPCPFVEGVS